jgi:hypothetical protein
LSTNREQSAFDKHPWQKLDTTSIHTKLYHIIYTITLKIIYTCCTSTFNTNR